MVGQNKKITLNDVVVGRNEHTTIIILCYNTRGGVPCVAPSGLFAARCMHKSTITTVMVMMILIMVGNSDNND